MQLYRCYCARVGRRQWLRWRCISSARTAEVYGGSGGGGSVLMSAILLRQMLICYIVKTPDGLTDSEIWGSGILSAVLFVRARARDVPRRRTLPLPFCIQRKTHPARTPRRGPTSSCHPRRNSHPPAAAGPLGRHCILYAIHALSCSPLSPPRAAAVSSSYRSKNPSSSSPDTKPFPIHDNPPPRHHPPPPHPSPAHPQVLNPYHRSIIYLAFPARPRSPTRFSPENAAICLGAREVTADAFAQCHRCAFLTQNKRMLLILCVFETFRLPEKLTLSRESAEPAAAPWLMDATVAASAPSTIGNIIVDIVFTAAAAVKTIVRTCMIMWPGRPKPWILNHTKSFENILLFLYII